MLRNLIKTADPKALKSAAERIAEWNSAGLFPAIFGSDVTLIPVPGRAPTKGPDTLWIPERVCQALLQAGLGREVWPGLTRLKAVPKSAFAAPGVRPELETHIESLQLTLGFPPTMKLLLVDDFVTKGRTILAAATVLNRTIPTAQIQAFAVVRTMGLVPDVEKIRWPVVGEIQREGNDARRSP